MTSIDDVQDLSPRDQYTASAAQTAFDYTFPIFTQADLTIYVDDVLQVLTTDYTVAGAGEETGGTVTFVNPMTGGEVVTIYRDIAIARNTDVQQNGPWSSTSYNDEMDKVFLIMQELENKIGRAIRFPLTAAISNTQALLDPISTYAGKFLRITSAGLLEAATALDNTVALSAQIIGELLNPRTAAEITAGVTIVDYSKEPGDVRRYGAVGDDSADSTAGITAAISVAAQSAGGATGAVVTFPTGTFLISGTIVLPNRVGLKGANGRGTVIKPHPSFTASGAPVDCMFYAHNSGSSMFGSYLQDLWIEARGFNMDTVIYSTAWQETCGLIRCVIRNDGTTENIFRYDTGDGGAAMLVFRECEFFCNTSAANSAAIRIDQVSAVGGFVFVLRDSTITGNASNQLVSGIKMAKDSLRVENYHGEHVESMIDIDGVGGISIDTCNGSANNVDNVVRFRSTFTGPAVVQNIIPNGATYSVLDERSQARSILGSEGKLSRFMIGEPEFSASLGSNVENVTGDGTDYTIAFDTVIYDYTDDFNESTGIFTAPRAGKYLLTAQVRAQMGLNVTILRMRIVTSNRSYWIYNGDSDSQRDSNLGVTMSGSAIADMDANDTARVIVSITGLGSDTADIIATETRFQGAYLCR